jgi:hypothetical protein
MTIEQRLSTVVSLLPAEVQAKLTAPLGPDESTDSRLIEAVRRLAKAEGLVCMTPGEFARAVTQHAAQRSVPANVPADENSPAALAGRLAALTDPRAQTAFWRGLTRAQRIAILKAE